MTIRPGQTYRSADPRETIRIRVDSYTPGENRAYVVDAFTGKRPRWILANTLHASPTTQAGKPRRSGYVLEQPATARQASGQADTEPDPTTADDPTPLRWGHGDVLHGDDNTVTVCLSGPDRKPYWLELDPERAQALRDDLAAPAEARPTMVDRTHVERALKDTRTRALIDAADALTAACPDHGTGDACTIRCQCDGADVIRQMAREARS